MRNWVTPFMAVAGLLVVSAPLSAQSANKIGYIDTRRVIQEAPGAAEARSTLEREMQALQTQLNAMEDSLKAMFTEYQQRQQMMSADAKRTREQELTAKNQAMQQRASEMQQHAQRRQQEVMQPIMTKVEQIIDDVRKAEGYAIVFDRSSEAIVSADPALDLTQKVIDRLKAAPSTATTRRP
jgi:outer membrane protein